MLMVAIRRRVCPVLSALAVGVFLPAAPISVVLPGSVDDPVLSKARDWLGTPAALSSVRTLEVTGTQTLGSGPVYRYHFKMLWPDKHLMDYPGGITHVVSGSEYWSLPTTVVVAAPPVSIERRQYDLNLHAIEFLLTPPPQSRLRVNPKGQGTSEGLSGSLIEISGPAPFSLTLVADPVDGHILGYTRPLKRVGATRGPTEGTEVVRFEDYRVVRGVKFPFRMSRSSFGIADKLVIEDLKVNENVSVADFVRR